MTTTTTNNNNNNDNDNQWRTGYYYGHPVPKSINQAFGLFVCFCWLSWLLVVRARLKLFGDVIWQISPMF